MRERIDDESGDWRWLTGWVGEGRHDEREGVGGKKKAGGSDIGK